MMEGLFRGFGCGELGFGFIGPALAQRAMVLDDQQGSSLISLARRRLISAAIIATAKPSRFP
jgi:hypothetical protein